MDDWPEEYKLQTVEQLRAAADDLRQRILEELMRRSLTVTQLGVVMKIAPAKVHYHVRELERVGLLKLVETRERGGILEKYYRTVARRLSVPRELFLRSSPGDPVAALHSMMDSTTEAFTRALLRAGAEDGPDGRHPLVLGRAHFWLTSDEFKELMGGLQAVFEKFEALEEREDARQYTFVQMAWDTALAAPDENQAETTSAGTGASAPSSASTNGSPHDDAGESDGKHRTWAVGVIHLDRHDLERAIESGKRLDITIAGMATFADDVTPELADRAIGRFSHRGMLRAPDGVLQVLERKEKATP